MASFAPIAENFNLGIKLLQPLEEISEFDRLGHSGALKIVCPDPGYLRVVPFQKPGGLSGRFGFRAPHADCRQIGFFPKDRKSVV